MVIVFIINIENALKLTGDKFELNIKNFSTLNRPENLNNYKFIIYYIIGAL